jgi:hypothetical protein
MVVSVLCAILTVLCAYWTVEVNRSYAHIDLDTLTFMDFLCPGSRVLGAVNCDPRDAANCDLLGYLCGKQGGSHIYNDAWWSAPSSVIMVRLAVARGANPNASAFGVSAITRALDVGNEKLLEYLLNDCGVDPNQTISDCGNPLLFAARSIPTAKILVEHIGDPTAREVYINKRNKHKSNVLHAVCECSTHSWLLIPWYCDHGLTPPYEALYDWTPIHSLAACIRRRDELDMHNALLSLLEAGIDPEKKEMVRGKTARQIAQEGLDCNLGGLLQEYKQKYDTFFKVLDMHKEKVKQAQELADKLKNVSIKK